MQESPDSPKNERADAERQLEDIIELVDAAGPEDLAACKRFLDHAPVAVTVSRRAGDRYCILYVNQAFEHLVGCSAQEVKGRDWSLLDAFRHEDDSELPLGQALSTDDDNVGTFRREGEEAVLVEVYAGTIEDEDGNEVYHIAALVDVSRRERAQREAFARQIREKDLLLREVQHRVKNNL